MEIETDRLILREFRKTDWKEVHEYARDPKVVYFMEWGPNTSDETVEFVERMLDNQRQKPRRHFELAVILKSEKKLIGAAGIRVLGLDPEQADVGYCFNSFYWSRGFATETCEALIRFGFSELKMHRIFATCDADNFGSSSVMKKNGMRQEAHFVQDKKIKGRWRDTLLFAILKEEWERTHGAN